MPSLADRLRHRIETEGPLTVASYMQACLSDPEAGYYRTGTPIGGEGDFITAPEVSQIFGELLGAWCIAVWQSMGKPTPIQVVELGPGRATLISDALRLWPKRPDFLAAAQLHLVEISDVLQAAQTERLADVPLPVTWHRSLDDVPPGACILLANEFLDALPVHQFVFRQGIWRERCVGLDPAGALVFTETRDAEIEASLLPAALAERAEDGDIVEVRPGAAELIRTLAQRAGPMAALFLDYGHTERGFGDTLQAVSRHRPASPLERPGEIDLTAHVDFAEASQQAHAAGLQVFGPMPQGAFLLKLGLAARRDALLAAAKPEQRQALTSGAARLVDPRQMGELFKVLAMTGPDVPAPPPFTLDN
jgi:NADH dehydrogenase [ubiquinone] 1 alpha subcomplex assembly factor 7